MGKGDVKSRKGKIWKGSFGNSRRKRALKVVASTEAAAKVSAETKSAK